MMRDHQDKKLSEPKKMLKDIQQEYNKLKNVVIPPEMLQSSSNDISGNSEARVIIDSPTKAKKPFRPQSKNHGAFRAVIKGVDDNGEDIIEFVAANTPKTDRPLTPLEVIREEIKAEMTKKGRKSKLGTPNALPKINKSARSERFTVKAMTRPNSTYN